MRYFTRDTGVTSFSHLDSINGRMIALNSDVSVDIPAQGVTVVDRVLRQIKRISGENSTYRPIGRCFIIVAPVSLLFYGIKDVSYQLQFHIDKLMALPL